MSSRAVSADHSLGLANTPRYFWQHKNPTKHGRAFTLAYSDIIQANIRHFKYVTRTWYRWNKSLLVLQAACRSLKIFTFT